MTLQLDALEQAIQITANARREVQWVSEANPLWTMLWHAEQYLAGEFKDEFNNYFKGDSDDSD